MCPLGFSRLRAVCVVPCVLHRVCCAISTISSHVHPQAGCLPGYVLIGVRVYNSILLLSRACVCHLAFQDVDLVVPPARPVLFFWPIHYTGRRHTRAGVCPLPAVSIVCWSISNIPPLSRTTAISVCGNHIISSCCHQGWDGAGRGVSRGK